MIQAALEESNCSITDVDIFAVALGPGSFTGLRIGIATAKSFASTLGREAVGVPTLEAVALAAGANPRVVALLPAGRGELFAQSFKVEAAGHILPLDEAAHVAPDALFKKLGGVRDIVWAGEGAQAQREQIYTVAREEGIAFMEEGGAEEKDSTGGWRLARPAENLAATVALIAFDRYSRGLAIGHEDLHAIYVRPSDAELKNVEHRDGKDSR